MRTRNTRSTASAGFTLIELLVVIGIIAILIGILLAVLSRVWQAAGKIKCTAILQQFLQVDQMYVIESKGFHLPAFLGKREASNMWTANVHFRKSLSLPMLKVNDVQASPPPGTSETFFVGYVTKPFVCPQAARLLDRVVAKDTGQQLFPPQPQYGMNVEGISDDPNLVPNRTWRAVPDDPALGSKRGRGFFGYKASQVIRPAEKLRIVDAMTVNSTGSPGVVDKSGSGVIPGTNGKISNYDHVQERVNDGKLPNGEQFDATRMTVWRHRGRANVAFFDGHVESLRKDQLYARDSTGKIITNDKLWVVMK